MTAPGPSALTEQTQQFLRSQRRLRYPEALATKHPHILNKIVQLNDNKDELRAYLHTLTHDDRGDRKGFSFEVLIDIQDLRDILLRE